MKIKRLLAGVLAGSGLALSSVASAAVVYSEGFESGSFVSSNWSVPSAYYANCAMYANCITTHPTWPTYNQYSEQAGNFYFSLATGGSIGAPPADRRFFRSSAFAVTANTDYLLTFWLSDRWNASENQPYTVPVLADVNGTVLGAGAVVATAKGWNKIDLAWNSGNATSAVISMANEYQTSRYWLNGGRDWGFGNDFAVDSISMASVAAPTVDVPEPGSMALVALALLGLGLTTRRRSR